MISLGVHDNYKVFNSSWASDCQAPLARARSDCLKVPWRVGPSQNNSWLKRVEGAERCLRLCTEGLLRSSLLVLLSVLVKDGAYYLPRNYIESSGYICCLIPLPLMPQGPSLSFDARTHCFRFSQRRRRIRTCHLPSTQDTPVMVEHGSEVLQCESHREYAIIPL